MKDESEESRLAKMQKIMRISNKGMIIETYRIFTKSIAYLYLIIKTILML
jgi:hypothetical protein